jgi:uncharacterized repeat protein (TIGR03803 family)
VFKVDATGKETVLYSFTGSGGDGAIPNGGLVLDAQGNLYGTTYQGGDLACAGGGGCGTVFKVDKTGKETVLHTFTGGDGSSPYAGLAWDAHGNLYSTTWGGGAYSAGTVFKLDTTDTETVLYSFTGGGDGGWPTAGLVLDAQGNLYGTALGGGDPACAYGCGTVFKLDTTGKETVLYSFTGTGGDGEGPSTGLVRDAKGNLYGTTQSGGDLACSAPHGCGTVFKVDTTGKETTLHTFTGTGGDGLDSQGDLMRDAQGNLYGTTWVGGAYNGGTVFKVGTTGKETVLYSFTDGADGEAPGAGLVRDTQGNLYGTTTQEQRPPYWQGTVFKLTPATTTTTTLTSSPNPSTYGQAVTFTAVVTSKSGVPPDGETVSFMKGKTVLGTGTLSGGTAKFTTSALPAGSNSITAVYAGDSNFAASTSKAVKQVVSKATTTTTLASSLNPSKVGQSVTFTASVTPEFSGTATGKVAFYDGTTLLKSVALSGGAAKYTTSTLTSGKHSITATYNGSTDFTGSSSAPLTQTVN